MALQRFVKCLLVQYCYEDRQEDKSKVCLSHFKRVSIHLSFLYCPRLTKIVSVSVYVSVKGKLAL